MFRYYKLKVKEYLLLFTLLVAGYIFTITQKYYIPEMIRPITLIVVFIGIFLLLYSIIKPKDPSKLSSYLSLMIFAVVAVIIIIQHVIIRFDISYKAAIILIASYLAPKIAYFIYKIVKRGRGYR